MLIWPWEDRNRRFSWLKASAFALMLLPAIRSAYLVGAGDYGSSLTVVLEGLTYWSGVWATVILLMALAVTPAATIFRWPAVIDVRRMIGVSALVYTIAHMVIYFAFRHWDFAYIVNDMTTRLTLVVATASTVGLIVLGATSVDAAVRYMGARNWQRLHTTNYVISALAILHVVLARGTYTEQYMLTGIFFLAYGLERACPLRTGRQPQGVADPRHGIMPGIGISRSWLSLVSPRLRGAGDAWLQFLPGYPGDRLSAGMASAGARTIGCAGRRRPRSFPSQSGAP